MPNGFCIRNVNCDYYLESQTEFNRLKYGKFDEMVPVLRIFGITEKGFIFKFKIYIF